VYGLSGPRIYERMKQVTSTGAAELDHVRQAAQESVRAYQELDIVLNQFGLLMDRAWQGQVSVKGRESSRVIHNYS